VHLEPEEELVVHDLQALLDHMSRIMESSLDEVVEIYRRRKRRVNSQALPDYMRDAAWHLLNENPLPAQPYELAYLPRNGLELFCPGTYYQCYRIGILKSDSGRLRVRGISRRKKRLYCQLPLAFAMFMNSLDSDQSPILPFHSAASIAETLNLVFMWDVDLKTGILHLALVCPKSVERNRAVVYWEHRIEHAALRIAKEQPQPVYDEDPDYGISLPDVGELGNGQEDD
jgi:hypothetical protein